MQESPRDRKKLGLYEVESIDNPCYATLAVNAKEYFEFFKDYMTNKKDKGIKKGSKGMEFANYANRIKPLLTLLKSQLMSMRKSTDSW